jgi:hypothetical protein
MVRHSFTLLLVLSITASCSSWYRSARAASQEASAQERNEWVGRVLQRMESVKPGMTRKNLLEVFMTEGGLSTGLQRTYGSRDCPFFKVDVEFEAVGRPSKDADGRVTVIQDDRDIIIKISRPYLAWPASD